jgi:hypothetical protein
LVDIFWIGCSRVEHIHFFFLSSNIIFSWIFLSSYCTGCCCFNCLHGFCFVPWGVLFVSFCIYILHCSLFVYTIISPRYSRWCDLALNHFVCMFVIMLFLTNLSFIPPNKSMHVNMNYLILLPITTRVIQVSHGF